MLRHLETAATTATSTTTRLRAVAFQSSGPLALNAASMPATGTVSHNGMPVAAGAGSDVRFTSDGYNPTVYTGHLESPCRMSGTLEVIGYYTAQFVAIR